MGTIRQLERNMQPELILTLSPNLMPFQRFWKCAGQEILGQIKPLDYFVLQAPN